MTTRNWWTDKDGQVKDFRQSEYLEQTWASYALATQALEQGRTLFQNYLDGIAQVKLEDAERKLLEMGGKRVFSSPVWGSQTGANVIYVWPEAYVKISSNDGDLDIFISTVDLRFFDEIKALAETWIGPKASAGRAYVLMTTEEGPKLQSIGTSAVKLERDNYNTEVLEDFDAIVADLKSKDPSGRLAIFDGAPGTGKTFLMRGLLDAVPEALFVLVPAPLVQELSSPSMISALMETRRNKGEMSTVFIIEDADSCLGARDDSNVNAVSALLNLGDGIIGSAFDIRLVCSTNLKNDELDEAVTRPGRLSRKVHVGPLEKKVAEKLVEKLTGKKIKVTEKITLAEVYTLARDAGWKPVIKKRSMGFGARDSDPKATLGQTITGFDPDGNPVEVEIGEEEKREIERITGHKL